MSNRKLTCIGNEIDLVYGKALPAYAREKGRFRVIGSNACIGHHSIPLVSGPGIVVGRKGSAGSVVYSADDFWPIDTTYYVRNKNNNDWRFLYHLLSSIGLKKLNSHSAIPGLSREDVYSIQFWLPEQLEQKLAVLVLDSIDEAIKTTKLAIDKTVKLKQFVMRFLFTTGTRNEAKKTTVLGFIPKSWDVVPLGMIAKIGNGSTPKKSISKYWNGGTYPWLTSSRIYDREISRTDHYVTNTALSECHLPRIPSGSLLIAITGQGKTLGHCAVLNIEATCNQHLAYVILDQNRAKSSFIRAYFETIYQMFRRIGSAGGSTKNAITCSSLRNIMVPLPSIEDQTAIVDFFNKIDLRIRLNQQKYRVLQNLFNAFRYRLIDRPCIYGDPNST